MEPIAPIIEFVNEPQSPNIPVGSPITGRVSEITCPLINQLGVGVEIKSSSREIKAPFSAIVVKTDVLLGQVILQAKNKLRLAVQLPVELIQHHGLGIKLHVKKGQQVQRNQIVCTVNWFAINQVINDAPVYVYWLNASGLKRILVPHNHVEAGQDILFNLITKQE